MAMAMHRIAGAGVTGTAVQGTIGLLVCGWSVLMAGCSRRGAALPFPVSIAEYVVPWANSFPSDVAVDDAGRVWFTDRLAHVIGRFDVTTLRFDSFPTSRRGSVPYGMLRAPDGSIWYAESGAGVLGRIDPRTERFEFHRIPGAEGGPHLIAWQDGVIWFSLRQSSSFGRYDTRTKETRIFSAPERPYSVAVAGDGHVWFNAIDRWQLYEVDPRTDRMRVHELGTAPGPGEPWGTAMVRDSAGERRPLLIRDSAHYASLPDDVRREARRFRSAGRARRMTVDPTGSVWVADFGRHRVVRYDPRTGVQQTYNSRYPQHAQPYGIVASAGGFVWFHEVGPNEMVVLDPRTGETARIAIRARKAYVRHVAIDAARNRVWLPMSDASRIGLLKLAETGGK